MKTLILFLILSLVLTGLDIKEGYFRTGRIPVLIRIISMLLVLVLMIMDCLCHYDLRVEMWACAASDILAGALALSCCGEEGLRGEGRSIRTASVIALTAIALILPQIWIRTEAGVVLKVCVMPAVLLALKTAYVALALLGGCRRVVALFANDRIWSNTVQASEDVFLLMLSLSPMLSSAAVLSRQAWLAYLAFAFAAVLYAVFFIRSASGSTLFIPKTKEKEILSVIRGSLRAVELEGGLGNGKMQSLYRRVMSYMEERRPYLDNDLDLDYFARKMFTNKVYLSRTINIFSGRNFRQFLNYHRIEYSISLMKKDPYLRVEEVSSMSGFNSTVSFNMAFRMFKGMTAREWLVRYRDGIKTESPATSRAEGR